MADLPYYWSYEEDIAPLRSKHFSDVTSSVESMGRASVIYGGSQLALKKAEEEERQRKLEDLNFQRNQAILKESAEKSRQQADLLQMEPQLQKRLGEIAVEAEKNPTRGINTLNKFLIENAGLIGRSPGMQLAINQLNESLNDTQTKSKSEDASLYKMVQIWSSVDPAKAASYADQIKDPNLFQEAQTLAAAATEAQNVAIKKAAADQDEKARKKAEEDRARDITLVESELIKMTPSLDDVSAGLTKGEIPPKTFSKEQIEHMIYLGKKLGLPEKDLQERGAKDSKGLKKFLLQQTLDRSVSGAKVGGTISGGMLPSPP